jgi:hypothetical protein
MKLPDQNPATDPWDEVFRHRFENFSVEPATDALSRILAGATGSPAASAPSRWPRALAMLVGLLLLVGGTWLAHQIINANTQKLQAHHQPVTAKSQSAVKPGIGLSAAMTRTPRAITPAVNPENEKQKLSNDYAPSLADLQAKSEAALVRVKDPISNKKSPKSTELRISVAKNKRSSSSVSSLVPDFSPADTQISKATTPRAATVGPHANAVVASSPLAGVTHSPNNLSAKSWHQLFVNQSFPGLVSPAPVALPAVSAAPSRPAFIVGLMPLYTYAQITPSHDDDVYVSRLQPSALLANERMGWQLQTGLEWALSKQFSFRASLIYSQFNQTVNYNTIESQPDSARIMFLDDQNVVVSPAYIEQTHTQTTTWHYAGLSSELIWWVGDGIWRPYISAGASVGTVLTPASQFSGFGRFGLGLERPLGPGLWLRIQPSVQYGLNKLSDRRGLFQSSPYHYGLSVGLRWR